MKILITEEQYIELLEGNYVDLNPENDIALELYDTGDRLELESIVVPKNLRKMGHGTKMMEKVIKYANDVNKPIYLTPDTSFGGTSFKRLVGFYKRFGFVKNDDKSKTKHFLVKYPQSKNQ